jgi:hypothetical protein
MVDFAKQMALERLTVRKDGLFCPQCCTTDPVHPGHGTPAVAFIAALKMAAERHSYCMSQLQKECDHSWDSDDDNAKCKDCKVRHYTVVRGSQEKRVAE